MKAFATLSAAAAAFVLGVQTCAAAPISIESSVLDAIDKILRLQATATTTATATATASQTTSLITPTLDIPDMPFRDGPIIFHPSTTTSATL